MTEYERRTEVETTADPLVTRDAATRRVSERYIETAGPGPASVAARIVTFVFGILQVLLVLRIILLLLVANQGNDIVSFVLGVSDPFVEPFRGMFALERATADRSILDIAAIVALIGWTLIEALILAGLRIFNRRPAAV